MKHDMLVLVKEIMQVPKGFVPIEATEGTAAWAYIQDVKKLEAMHSDPAYIGSFIEDYGYLSIFTDGSCMKTEVGDGYNAGDVKEGTVTVAEKLKKAARAEVAALLLDHGYTQNADGSWRSCEG